MEVVRFWVTITWSFTVQTAKILTDAYTSRIVRGQSTLKDVTERYLWNGLSRERLKAMKALYALIAMKALCALYAKYANVLVEKPTLVEKRKMLNLKQSAYTLCNLLNNTTTVRLKNKSLMDANCL